MKAGLLWYDADPQRPLEEKLAPAVQRYRQKFGRLPDVCYVNPRALTSSAEEESGVACRLQNPQTTIRIVTAHTILMHHFWLGENGMHDTGKPTREIR